MNQNFKRKNICILILIILFIKFSINFPIISFKFFISSEFEISNFWVGERHKIIIQRFPENSDEKIYFESLNNKIDIEPNFILIIKSSGRECLTAYTKINRINETICFNIYNTPNITFKENDSIRLEINDIKQLNLEIYDYPKSHIKYESNHEEIIKVNKEGKIRAIRPGSAVITASGLDNVSTKIKVLSISKKGLLKNYRLDIHNSNKYDNLMIVAHPDDETLWGGAHLIKENYFVVCLTNGYNTQRANDYKKIIKFTKNSGIILNYPDIQDNKRDNWSEVEDGILKDISYLLSYKYWKIIVTHGPEGTTGHPHHKIISKYVSKISKEKGLFNRLYYFGKFYKKNEMPNNLKKISDKEFAFKIKEVSLYKSVKEIIYKLWFHFLPYENWISAVNWEKNNIIKNNKF